ncbi:Ku protein [Streptomyces sp. JJ36]|uniref:non-homologous end joining protein Ku n=1 Tax=Streptomyces sp. JJ36 TaxID=2736645 RepID=UPI001F01CBF8|nr:Ku protein [Streptomyces sp. JJ36]MCF6525702.1 Ku protein [Streptomyces sp. JJ36]
MARAVWSGVLTFGLVTVPVQLFTATEDHTTHFRQFQRGTGDRVRNRRVNGRTGEEVDYGEIVKGYDLGGGDYVVVEPDELEEIAPGRSRTIDVSAFVDLEQVEPVYFARTYYLAPKGEEYAKVYELLRQALAEEHKTGIATFVLRSKEYLVAVRAQEQVLVLHTLHWADEVRDPQQELPVLPGRTTAGQRELRTARQLVEALSTDWRPEEYHDTFEERVHELIAAKRKGEEVVAAEGPPEATNVVDLMDALQRSIDTAGSRPRGRGRRGRRESGGAAAGEQEVAGLSKKELSRLASELQVPGRSKMSREELARAVAQARAGRAAS